MEDVTIILQGKTSFEGLDAWTKNGKDLKIVLSTWIDVPIEKFEIPEKWTVIKSPYPERYGGINNLDYQITSTLNGLKHVNTEYCIKMRADEYFSDVWRLVREMKLKHEKILSANIFFKAYGPFMIPYHIGDHFLAGKTENVKLLFENAYSLMKNGFKFPEKYSMTHNPEPYLGFAYIQNKEQIDLTNLEPYLENSISAELVDKYFEDFDIGRLRPYFITYRGEIYTNKCDGGVNF